MKLYIRAPFTEKRIEDLREWFDEIVYDPWTDTGERFYEDEMQKALTEVQPDALITELDVISEKVLKSYDKLQFIGDCRAAPENLDVDACTRAGVPILCTPARNSQAVAEMLAGLLVAYMRNLCPAVRWVEDGSWVEGTTPYYLWRGHELCGKRVGFVGFGAVGKAAAKILDAFGCDISFYDPYVNEFKNYKKCSLEEIFETADIVSLHLPVTEETKGMIGKDLIGLMKESAILVNTSRSAVLDMAALEAAVSSKKIQGAILDVLPKEPPSAEELRIGTYDNVLLTPHICGATYEVVDHQADIMTDRIRRWMTGDDAEQVVYNKAVLEVIC